LTIAWGLDVVFAFSVLLIAAKEDREHYTISLLPMLLGVVGGLIVSASFYGWRGLVVSLLGGAVGGLLGGLLAWGAKLGAGDVYLYVTLGAIFGPSVIMIIFAMTNVLVLLRMIRPLWQKRQIRIAVAPYILVGTVLSLLWRAFV
jgi:prepilin peptidase CpaA